MSDEKATPTPSAALGQMVKCFYCNGRGRTHPGASEPCSSCRGAGEVFQREALPKAGPSSSEADHVAEAIRFLEYAEERENGDDPDPHSNRTLGDILCALSQLHAAARFTRPERP